MSDIVERLEYTAKHGLTKAADAHRYASHAEARDEIVRLRADWAVALREIGVIGRELGAVQAENDRLREQLDILIAGEAGMWGTIAAKKSKEAREAEAECARMRAALEKLIERAEISDEVRYGTLSTAYVRDICRAALGATPKAGDTANVCDCERSHNGLGISGRECDCAALGEPT